MPPVVLVALALASAPSAADTPVEPAMREAQAAPAVADAASSRPREQPAPVRAPTVTLLGGRIDPRGPYRMPAVGGSLLMQVPVAALGSPNQTESMMLWTLRAHAGARAIAAIASFAAGPLAFPSGSIADGRRGELLEGGFGVRWLPVQHRVVRFGPWLAALFDRTRIDVELEDGGRRLRGHKLLWDALLEVGLEVDLRLVPSTPQRPVRIDGVIATGLRMAAPLGTRLELDDGDRVSTMEHAPAQLRTLGPFGGASATVVLGIQVEHDLARPVHEIKAVATRTGRR